MSTNDEIIAAVRQALADTPQQSQIIADITKTQALMAQQQEQILEMVKKHQETLYGNGKVGLVTIVSQLSQASSRSLSMWADVLKWVIIAAITIFVTLAVQHGIVP